MVTQQSLADLAVLFSELGRDLLSGGDADSVLGLVSARCVELVPAAEHAGVSRGRDGRFETVGATSEVPLRVDQIQYQLGSGPCVDAALQQSVFRTGDLSSDPRWPEFGQRAAEQEGILSMLSIRLFLENSDLVAALNLYSTQPAAFCESDETTTMLLATHASLAVAGARLHEQVANLERALRSNRGIGVAMGVLMNQYKITQEQAFDLLRMASQHSHRKLVDVARDVTETGALELPPLPGRRT
jgi:GAF domain-containing protein